MGKRKLLNVFLIALAAIGALDAGYLTYQHYASGSVVCGIAAADCDLVLHSEYSTIFGIPLALVGFLYYGTVFGLSFAYFRNRKGLYLRSIAGFTGLGFLISLILTYIQLFVLEALCTFCLTSALVTTALFAISVYLLKGRTPEKRYEQTYG